MTDSEFPILTKIAFNKLITDFNCSILLESNREVMFTSPICTVRIFVNLSEVFVDIIENKTKLSLDLADIVLVKNPNENFRYSLYAISNLKKESNRLAKYLFEYASDVLLGDFSLSGVINQIHDHKLRYWQRLENKEYPEWIYEKGYKDSTNPFEEGK